VVSIEQGVSEYRVQYTNQIGERNERTTGNMRSRSLLRAREIPPKESDDDADAERGEKGNE